MKLDKHQALELTLELWEWLAKTGSPHKQDWPGWETYGGMFCCCPLCDYCIQQSKYGRDCHFCPLYGKWRGKDTCVRGGSPFSDWCDSYRVRGAKEKRQQYAQEIVDLCQAELDAMDKE